MTYFSSSSRLSAVRQNQLISVNSVHLKHETQTQHLITPCITKSQQSKRRQVNTEFHLATETVMF